MINWQPGMTLEHVEKMVILKAYNYFSCNKTRTSEALGIAVRTLDAKLEKYAQPVPLETERPIDLPAGAIPPQFADRIAARRVEERPQQIANNKGLKKR